MKRLIIGIMLFVSIFLYANTLTLSVVSAQASNQSVPKKCKNNFLGFPHWYEYLDIGQKGSDECAIIGPTENGEFSFEKALPRVILALIDILMRVAGMVAVAYVIFGGFKYITAQGEPDKLKQAQTTITNALIGLVIALLSVPIINFIGRTLWT